MWAIIKKDIIITIKNPIRIAATFAPSLLILLLLFLQGAAVSGSPIAVVNQDNGSISSKFQQAVEDYDGFYSVTAMSEDQAKDAYDRLKVSAILTISSGFTDDITAGKQPALNWQVRNFNADSANDLRRALPDIINDFIQNDGSVNNPINITVAENDMNPHDAGFLAFQLVAILVVLLLQASIVNAGLASVGEWETGNIKGLLVSPAKSMTVIFGKIITGVIISAVVGTLTVTIAQLCGLLPFEVLTLKGALLALLAAVLLSFFGSGLGVMLGSVLRSTEKAAQSSIMIAFFLFFLSGGIVAIAYLPGWVQAIAHFIPNPYAVNILRDTLLYGTGAGIPGDMLILLIAAVVGIVIAIPSMRRELAH